MPHRPTLGEEMLEELPVLKGEKNTSPSGQDAGTGAQSCAKESLPRCPPSGPAPPPPPAVGATPTTCAAGRSWRDRGQQPPGLPGACGERLPLEGRGMLAQRPCEPRSEASPGPRVRPRAEWSGLWGHVVKGQPCHCPVLWANPITSQALFSSSQKWGLPS